jgi:hypothetical protein
MPSDESADSLALPLPKLVAYVAAIFAIFGITIPGIFAHLVNVLRLLNGRELVTIPLVIGILATAAAVVGAVLVVWLEKSGFWRGLSEFRRGVAAGGALVALATLIILPAILLAAYLFEGGRSLRISQPQDGDIVDVEVLVEGSFSRLPEDQSIWVAVVPLGLDEDLFYPQNGPAVKSYGGSWQAHIFVGLDDPADYGRSFEIHAVLADGDAGQQFRDYLAEGRNTGSFPGLKSLPGGSEIMDTVTVTRPGSDDEDCPRISIVQPEDGSAVGIENVVSGTSCGLTPGQPPFLHVFVRPVADDPNQLWHAQEPVELMADGIWSAVAFVGTSEDAAGTPFLICAVGTQTTYAPGKTSPVEPPGPSACIEVTRKGPSEISISILEPEDGSTVDVENVVSGTSSGLTPGQPPFLHVFVRPIPDDPSQLWHAQNPVELLPDGAWSGTAFVGIPDDPPGTPYRVCAIATETSYEPGRTSTAKPTGPSDCVDVIRSGRIVNDCPQIQISILKPGDGSVVDIENLVSGTSCGLTPYQTPFLHVFVRPIPDDPSQLWHAQNPVELMADGTWSATAFVGIPEDPRGTPYRLCAVATGTTYKPGQTSNSRPEGPSDCVDLTRSRSSAMGATIGPQTPPPTPPVQISLVQPADGSEVGIETSVSGGSSGLILGQPPFLHVFVRPIPDDPNQLWHAQNQVKIRSGGTWSTTAFVGIPEDPPGTPYRICAIATQKTYAPNEKTPGRPAGPSHCIKVTRIVPPPCPEIQTTIVKPEDGSVVDIENVVSGTSCGLTPYRSPFLHVFVRPIPDDPNQLWHAQEPVQMRSDGTWYTTAFVGIPEDPPGTPFLVCAIATQKTYAPNEKTPERPTGPSHCISLTRR